MTKSTLNNRIHGHYMHQVFISLLRLGLLLEEWKINHPQVTGIQKNVFPSLLKKLFVNLSEKLQNSMNGFAACGIYPFDKEVVLRKFPSSSQDSEPNHILSGLLQDTLKRMRYGEGTSKQPRCIRVKF